MWICMHPSCIGAAPKNLLWSLQWKRVLNQLFIEPLWNIFKFLRKCQAEEVKAKQLLTRITVAELTILLARPESNAFITGREKSSHLPEKNVAVTVTWFGRLHTFCKKVCVSCISGSSLTIRYVIKMRDTKILWGWLILFLFYM